MSGQQDVGKVDHQEGQTDGVADSGLRNVHEIFETEILLGIAEIELNLEAQGIVIGQ